jgi:hypothetical protein
METVFKVNFFYEISPPLQIKLNADVELHHSEPHYLIRNISHITEEGGNHVLPDISIKAIKNEDGEIIWVHTDSERETILSKIVGESIEKSVQVEISNYNN